MNRDITRLVIGCHKDKELLEQPPASDHYKEVQAGAALTDKRIYGQNDHDGFDLSISDRNPRYSEMTAVWWARHNISSDYVGIEHYRRRFCLSDAEISSLIDKGVSLITLKKLDLEMPLYDFMNQEDFASVFDKAIEIVKLCHPEDFELTAELVNETGFHPCNMNIWSLEHFRDYCDWLFPMLEIFYKDVPEKRDAYLHRDVGFMAERLSHVYVEKLIRSGISYAECDYVQLKSSGTEPEDVPSPGNREAFMSHLEKLFSAGLFRQCRDTLLKGYSTCEDDDINFYSRYARVFHIYMDELKYCDLSLFEYLPGELTRTLSDTAKAVMEPGTKVLQLLSDPSQKTEEEFVNYMTGLRFSGPVIGRYIKGIANNPDVYNYVAAVLNDGGLGKTAIELIRWSRDNV
ncbi:MAG: DUF4422 domain-containing protein [Lachnospiraceae bacterium]|nr:DUF4422 domain-containing protein [Lachnospiraceae bacterium]